MEVLYFSSSVYLVFILIELSYGNTQHVNSISIKESIPLTTSNPYETSKVTTVHINRGAARQMYGSGSLRQPGTNPLSYYSQTTTNVPPLTSKQSPTKNPFIFYASHGSSANILTHGQIPMSKPIYHDMEPIPVSYIPPGHHLLPNVFTNNNGQYEPSSRSGFHQQIGQQKLSNSNYRGRKPSTDLYGGRYSSSHLGLGYTPERGSLNNRYSGIPHSVPNDLHRSQQMQDQDILDDGIDNISSQEQRCGEYCNHNEFACTSSCICIKKELRCNNEIDCNNSEDELGCGEENIFNNTPCNEENNVRCPNSGQCISKDWLCDGDDDCGDFSDETHCISVNCTEDQFECANGLCIQKSWVCDNDNDCKDFSDEMNCTKECKSHEFQCNDGSCITMHWKCDQEPDCRDGSDETECADMEPPSCSNDEFQCSYSAPYHRCIRIKYRCDGDNDCGDWSDEVGCEEKPKECGPGEFKCDDKCIPERMRCDKEQDCQGGEDEMHCNNTTQRTCSSDEYTCNNKNCILKTWVCDGIPDCSSGEDEQKCQITCDENQFTCKGGTTSSNSNSSITVQIQPFCVNRKHVCDGQKDCPHGEDEENCPKRIECNKNSKCEQLCILTADGKNACSCRAGYTINLKDGYSCIDINECLFETEPVCSQICNNTIGSFICSCTTGYILRPDMRTCKADGASPTLLFANRVDIRQLSLSNSKYISVLKGLHNAIALDYHYKKGTVYWSDVSKDVIQKAFVNGTQPIDVIKWGLESPSGVAIDWIHDFIFWTDSGTKRVEVATLDGRLRYVIVASDLDKPRAIAVHPGQATVFWTDWGPNPKIERSDMDGSNRKNLIVDGIFWPNGLTLDYTADKLYWADAKHHVIESCSFDGKDRKKIISKGLPHPFAITIFEDIIYWTDWHTKAISSAHKIMGTGFRTIHYGLHFPMDIHSYHPQRQPHYNNRCGNNNGGCSHMCLPNTKSYTCVCPLGQKLNSDKRSCQAPEKLLLYARKKDLRLRQFEKGNRINTNATSDIVIPLEGVKSAVALAWDSTTDSIFWTDVEKDTINRAHLNGTNQKAIITTNLISPAGLALDWVTNKLYWTDAGTNRIEVSNTDGTMRTLLIWEGLDKPRDIVVDPTLTGGYMYWSDWGDAPKIERAAMDGSMRKTLFEKNLTWPNGLAIDHSQSRIYWADGGTKTIEYANLDGSNRRILIGTNLKHPFGLDIFGNKIYWTDWETSSIQSAHKSTSGGVNRTILGIDLKGLMDVCVFHRTRPKIKSPCHIKNGGCSHLCLIRPNGYSCACPMGIKLGDDGKSCANGPKNYLIFAHRVDIRQISLDVEYIVDVVLPLPSMKNALAVDVDRKTGEIYWTDSADDLIRKASPNGKIVETIISNAIERPDGIVIDSTGRKIYWTDADRNSIEVAELDGSNRKVLIWSDLDSPRAITLHYHHGLMFWSDWGTIPRIECAHMDGSNRKTIVSEGLIWPNGLAIDRPAGRLYWNDGKQKTIESSDLNGHDRRIIISDVKHPYGLVVVGNHMYWTDWETETVHRADKINGSDRTIIRDKLDGLMDIRSVQAENTAENACGTNNGGCSHLCLRNPVSYTCACPTGVLHKPDSKTECQSQPSTYLLFATRSALARVSLDTRELWDVTLPIENIYNAIAVDFHWQKGVIFFTDVQLRVIRSVSMFNYSKTQTIVDTNLTAPDGIAVDWIANNLYWTDTGRKVLEISKIDGSSRKILIKDGLDEPRSVALYPKLGFLYWTDWSDHRPKIERSMLDGSSRRIIINTQLGFPNGLTLDYASRRLYWSDALRDRIETSDLNGQDRMHLVPDATHPFGLAQYMDHIYWTDWFKKSIIRADKANGKNKVVIRTDLDGVMEIKAVSAERQLGWNPCAVENGGCTHLCLFRQDNYTCACPDDIEEVQRTRCSIIPKFVVPNERPDGESTKDIDYENPLQRFIPMYNSSYNNDRDNMNMAHQDVSSMFIVFVIIILSIVLLIICAVIGWMMFNRRKTKKDSLFVSGRSVRTFANPNYYASSDNNLNGSSAQVVEKKTAFSWKRIKYDKSQDRVYEEKVTSSSPEYASLIPDVLRPNSITPERSFNSPPPTPPHRVDSIPLQTIG